MLYKTTTGMTFNELVDSNETIIQNFCEGYGLMIISFFLKIPLLGTY